MSSPPTLKKIQPLAFILNVQMTGERNATEADDETVISFSEGWNCTLEYFKEVQLKKEYYGPYQAVTVPLYTKPREFCSYFSPWF
jgi:hypothetical protein